jgi:ankyrin repeat protein
VGKHDDITAFHEALWRGETATVARLAPKIDPDGEDRWQRRPLAMAAQYGDLALVTLLLRRGAAVDAGRVYLTPITYAARRRADDLVRALRAAGGTVSIVTSVYLGDRRAVARVSGAVSVVDEDGTPLLLHAAESLHAGVVGDLLDRGASTSAGDRFGETALHRVADLRNADPAAAAAVSTLLLDRGAAVDAVNRDAVTPLHQAVRARNLAVARVLLARGADPNARDKRGATPLHRAVAPSGAGGTAGADATPLVEALLAHGADPGLPDKRGRTPRAAARAPAIRTLVVGKRSGPRA